MHGRGRLIIWHNVVAAAYDDFEAWVENEHIPERVGVSGFLRCRRFRGIGDGPSDMNIYEAVTPDVFVSSEYVDRLNSPTQWTQRVMPNLRDPFARASCALECRVGRANGASVAVFQSAEGWSPAALASVVNDPRIVSLEQAVSVEEASNLPTVERKLRGQRDAVATKILICEGTDPEKLRDACQQRLGETANALVGMFRIVFELRAEAR